MPVKKAKKAAKPDAAPVVEIDERIGKLAVINVHAGSFRPGRICKIAGVMSRGILLKVESDGVEALVRSADVTII